MQFSLLRVFILMLGLSQLASAQTPNVVTSIVPLHALASAVMQGVTKPYLLIEANNSPHHFQLRPSQLSAIQSADLIIWVGPSLEQGIAKVILRPSIHRKSLTLIENNSINKLQAREAGIWHEEHAHHEHGQFDPHIWLSPANAIAITQLIADRLATIDKQHAAQYQSNADTFKQHTQAVVKSIQTQIAAHHVLPYLVLHDAFHYFEDYFNLPSAGAISIDPEHSPGARRIQTLRDYIRKQKLSCLFREPQLSDRMLNSISQGLPVKTGVLDPIGIKGDSYEKLLQTLSQAINSCQKP